MEPRVKTSKKWTPFPEELETQILDVLKETFEKKANVGRFIAEGRIYQEEVLLRLGYLENGRLVQSNAEVSIQYNMEKENVQKIIGLAVDCAGGLLNTFFDNPNEELPQAWQAFPVDKKDVFMQFSTLNSELEAEADRLLGLDTKDGLVIGTDDDLEADAIKAMLGLSDDDDSDDNLN